MENPWWEDLNMYAYPAYPYEAAISSVENIIYTDTYGLEAADTEFYYGYKECQRLGIEYIAPNPTIYNNLG